MMNELITIIIPSYNRAHLIEATLDSIIAQSYSHWECLVVDDGSTDKTTEVVSAYAERDKRLKLFKRTNAKPKGANACRNIGLDNAKGEYVVFFDSDDLMTENHIEVKVNAIQKCDCDYVITKTQYFNYNNKGINKYYQFDKFPITPFNYIAQKINWLTYDIGLKTSLAKSISFNENLQSGQEYNYFSKLVHISTKGVFIDEVVTLRRYHEDSIRSRLSANHSLQQSYFNANWYTYLDLKHVADNLVIMHLIRNCIKITYFLKSIPTSDQQLFIREIFKVYGFKGFYFILMLFGRKYFNKGYFFRQKLLRM